MNAVLTFSNVSLTYGEHAVLENFNLHLQHGEKLVVMGPSGSGKTSLLRLAAGLTKPTTGQVSNTASKTAVQFQEPRLLPHLTVLQNINAVLSDKKATLPLAKEWLQRVELTDAAHLLPCELSGGMAQRAALARALVYGGDLYLLDEPFRGLDAALKERMISLVLEHTANRALLLITHDDTVAQKFAVIPPSHEITHATNILRL